MDIESKILREFELKSDKILPEKFSILKIVRELKDKVYRPDFKMKIRYYEKKIEFSGEIWNSDSSASFKMKLERILHQKSSNPSEKSILLSRYLSENKQEECKKLGINFVDLCGNLYIAEDGIYIEKLGNKNEFQESRKNRSPFSDKASLVIRKLILDDKRYWGIRELAESIQLDPGFVSRIINDLYKRNYIIKDNSQIRLVNGEQILRDWVESYNPIKNSEIKYFSPGKNVGEILAGISNISFGNPGRSEYALGYQAGGNLVYKYSAYDVVHIYISNDKQIDMFKELNLAAVDKGANIIFLLPYYKNSVFFDKQLINGLWVVSDIQLYIDLYNYPLRGREQAEKIYDFKLKKLFNKK